METFKYKILLILFLGSIPGVLFAQIPNSGFEQWIAGNPEGWYVLNLFGFGIPITQATPGHSGSWALRGEVITSTLGDARLPQLVSGQSGDGYTILERYSALTGIYKFSAAGGDQFVINIMMYTKNNYIRGGYLFITATVSNYTIFTVPINYPSSEIPDHCVIQMMIGDPTSIIYPDSYYLIDDLSLPTDPDIQNQPSVTVPVDFELLQNYPNPFNPTTEISYQLPVLSEVQLTILNSLGQEIKTLVSERQSAGNYTVYCNGSNESGQLVASGIYFHKLQA